MPAPGSDTLGETLRHIYDARIPGRIEWLFDDGFVWVLVQGDGGFPRMWLDDELGGIQAVAQTELAAEAQGRSRRLERDWLHRGRARTIDAAVEGLAQAIVEVYPQSDFTRWWREERIPRSSRPRH